MTSAKVLHVLVTTKQPRRYYPRNWRSQVRRRCQLTGSHCERCGLAAGLITFSRRGTVYTSYLVGAHLGDYTEQPTILALCPRCHGKLDARRRRRQRTLTALSQSGQCLTQLRHRCQQRAAIVLGSLGPY